MTRYKDLVERIGKRVFCDALMVCVTDKLTGRHVAICPEDFTKLQTESNLKSELITLQDKLTEEKQI